MAKVNLFQVNINKILYNRKILYHTDQKETDNNSENELHNRIRCME